MVNVTLRDHFYIKKGHQKAFHGNAPYFLWFQFFLSFYVLQAIKIRLPFLWCNSFFTIDCFPTQNETIFMMFWSIETSALPTPVEVRRLYEERPASEIRSSRDDVDHSDDVVVVLPASYRSARPVFFGQQQQQQRQQQQQPPLLSVLFPSNSPQTVTMSFTATTTVFSFTDTIVKKTLNLVAPPPEGVGGPLTCLPMGFVVC